ncbi:hypothetical protein [Chachezhania sediminis]|uniref:hypothetical protein n=1 Tax=Chachezhania sediminis TaxID=2599291 RepID=UPI00131DAB5C|nr:hypothetical protein [Chachezhania sediminis]
MNDQHPNLRIVLGPEAARLIQNAEGNRPMALDQAILDLQQRADRSGDVPGAAPGPLVDLTCLEDRLAAIEAQLAVCTGTVDRLRLVALAEMRMTRLYIAAMMEAREEGDLREILAIGHRTAEHIYDELEVLTQDDVAHLTRDEDRVVQMIREEMHRGTAPEALRDRPERERD